MMDYTLDWVKRAKPRESILTPLAVLAGVAATAGLTAYFA